MLQEIKTELASTMSWKEYRAIDLNSYSTLSQFQKDRKQYYKKYILKEKTDEKPNPYFIYGSLVDCLLFTPAEFKSRYLVSTAIEPAPQMAEFTRNLAKRIIENVNSSRKESIRSLMQYAYTDTKFSKNGDIVAFKAQTPEKTIERFFKECKEYMRTLLEIEMGTDIISVYDYDRAQYAISSLANHVTIGPIVRQESDDRYKVHKQLVVFYEINGMKLKSMLDLVIIDTYERKVFIYDLKTSHNVEEFNYCFTKFNYYIQLGCYTVAILTWMQQNGYDTYELVPMKFIVVDNNNYLAPLLYESTSSSVAACLLGFRSGSKWYDGVFKIIHNIQWHTRSGIWNISRDNYLTNGIMQLDFCQEVEIISEPVLESA